MVIFNKYLSKNIFFANLLVLTILTFVIWLSQSLRFINLLVSTGMGIKVFIKLSLLMMPPLISIALPISCFISILYVYNKLIIDSELVILHSAGLSRFDLSKPAFNLAVIAVLLNYILTIYFIPVCYKKFKDVIFYYRDNYASVLIEEGVFNTKIKGLTIYIEERLEGNKLKGILVHDERDVRNAVTIIAQKGIMEKDANGSRLVLINGNRQSINDDGELSILYFDELAFNITHGTDQVEKKRAPEIEEVPTSELLDQNLEHKNQKKYQNEIVNRLTWPLYNILLIFVSLISIFKGEFSRKDSMTKIFISILAASLLVIIGRILLGVASTMLSKYIIISIYLSGLFSAFIYVLYKRES